MGNNPQEGISQEKTTRVDLKIALQVNLFGIKRCWVGERKQFLGSLLVLQSYTFKLCPVT